MWNKKDYKFFLDEVWREGLLTAAHSHAWGRVRKGQRVSVGSIDHESIVVSRRRIVV
jgi:hypothetical protein